MNRQQRRALARRARAFPGIEMTINGEQRLFVANRDAIPRGPCWFEHGSGGIVRIVPITPEMELAMTDDEKRQLAQLRHQAQARKATA